MREQISINHHLHKQVQTRQAQSQFVENEPLLQEVEEALEQVRK